VGATIDISLMGAKILIYQFKEALRLWFYRFEEVLRLIHPIKEC